MKNLLLFVVLVLSVNLFGQGEYSQWKNIVVKPKYDQLQSFGESMHEHNKTFHREASTLSNVWRVTSGPNMGSWIISSGPYTFTGLDSREMGEGHGSHWRNSVMPNVAEMSDGGTWRMVPSLSYMPEGMELSNIRVIVHDLRNGNLDGYYDAMQKLAETHKEKMPGMARIYLDRVGFHNDGMDKVIVIGLTSWSDMDTVDTAAAYEEVHGEGSWDLFIEDVNGAVRSSYEEHWSHVPYLSGEGGE